MSDKEFEESLEESIVEARKNLRFFYALVAFLILCVISDAIFLIVNWDNSTAETIAIFIGLLAVISIAALGLLIGQFEGQLKRHTTQLERLKRDETPQ